MKTLLYIHFILTVAYPCFGQFGPQQIISSNAGGARGVFASDLDGDGDLDVIAAAESDDKVAWYENMDGLGDFGPEITVTQTLHAAVDVVGADLDGDTDIDILVASKGHSQSDGKVVWYRNMDGQGNFTSSPLLISDLTMGPVSVFAVDLDGDDDLDVLSASFVDNKVAWYENDGLGNFGPQLIITNTALSTRDVIAADIDGDDDPDVLTVSTASDEVLWFENLDGAGTFGSANIVNANTNGALSVFAADLDGDDDLDVLSNSPGDGEVYWYENLNGAGSFGLENLISETLVFPQVAFAEDVDNDEDKDVLIISANDDRLVWHENMDGLGNFGPENLISNEVDLGKAVYSADLDDDGDMDVLSASKVDNKIAWYENLTILASPDFSSSSITITPNPVQNTLKVESSAAIQKVAFYDLLGQKLMEVTHGFNSISMSGMSSGLLFVEVKTNHGEMIKKIIKE